MGGHSAASAFKFRVSENVNNSEASFAVDAVTALTGLDEGGLLSVVEDIDSNETDVSRNRDEKRNPIDKHDVDAKCDITIGCHDLFRKIVCDGAENPFEFATSGLSLDGADVASENSMGIYGILSVDGTVGK